MKLIIKNIEIMSLFFVLLFISETLKAQEGHGNKMDNISVYDTKGTRAPAENFTGTVWVSINVNPEDNYNTLIGTVNFEPKGRTNWHSHTNGQILFVTAGIGYYQEKGKPIHLIKKGDVIKIPKNVKHWHGASHNQPMTHIAIITEIDNDKTEWFEPVTDQEYDSYQSDSQNLINNLSEKAIKNHEELWPGYKSRAKETDPELIEVFDNFAFDEVISYGNLDTKTRVMMILGSTIASHALGEYKMFVNAALNVGVTPVEVKEILYQSVPYVGISKVVDFIYSTNEIFTERGIKLPLEGQSTTTRETRYDKGLAVQKSIFGEMIDKMYETSPEDQLHIQKYLSANCFGDYYTRNSLDIKTRELLTYSMLISMDGTETQVRGHIRGNLNVGNDKQTLLSVTTQLLPYIGYPRTLNAIKAINEVAGN